MKIVVILLMIIVTLFLIVVSVYDDSSTEDNQPVGNKADGLFQGPVPMGYDVQYFRETGITKKISN